MTRRGRVVMFTGPSGAGKTTVAEAWASSRGTATACYDHDHARFIVRSGYVSRSAAHRDPTLHDEADRQWLLAASVCEAMAEIYVTHGIDFALSAYRPPGDWKGCWRTLDAMAPLIVVLLPSVETALARDEQRQGRMRVGAETVRRAYRFRWDDWRVDPRALVVDNSALEIADMVSLVERELAVRQEI